LDERYSKLEKQVEKVERLLEDLKRTPTAAPGPTAQVNFHSEKVGGDGNGVILEIQYPSSMYSNAAEKLAKWIKDRLLSSNQGDSLLSMTIVTKASTVKEMNVEFTSSTPVEKQPTDETRKDYIEMSKSISRVKSESESRPSPSQLSESNVRVMNRVYWSAVTHFDLVVLVVSMADGQ
ncbi:hypothetical protein QZH41_008648, partial [Actinostola sp. cb2023]